MDAISPDFTEKTKKILAKMASERCCLCEEITSIPNSSDSNYVRIGEAAHISGARKSSDLRFIENLTNEDRKNHTNGIWLCSNCHTTIDQDEIFFTIDKLHKIRAEHYQRIRNGRYSKSSFTKIDELNAEIIKLNQKIKDKEKLLQQSDKIFQIEITDLRMKIQNLIQQKEKLWEDYNSILINIEQADQFDEIYRLVFEENNLERALEYLSDDKLEKEEKKLARQYILKADIFKLQNKKEAAQYYRKAYAVHQSFNVAKFYIRYLDDIRNFNSLAEFMIEILETGLNIEDRIALNGQLGTIYSKINPDLAEKYYKTAINLIDQKIEHDPHYYTLKAGFLNYLGASYKNNNNLVAALSACEESLTIFISGKIPLEDKEIVFYELAALYNTIARIYILNQNYVEAEQYVHLAVKIAKEKINDEGELLATIYINFCSLFNLSNSTDNKAFVEIVDQTISIFTALYEKNPLQFVEKLVASHCKKAEFSFALNHIEEFHHHLAVSEIISQQFVELHQKGFEFLLSEIYIRRASFYIISGDSKMASEQVDKALLYFENSQFNDSDTISKYASLSLLKCRLTDNRDQKKNLLVRVKQKMKPFINNNSTSLYIYNEIQQELKKI
ncbi:hypothetical protein CFS9_38990 [Flavobacterium sp. CFS9]|uniref:HNH endonuclease n=1 Tax=Flavobacterium sp. CFS9 TaxID=3143118 RepID=A0AAT9H6V0_9FLAO